jgi:putative endonuclease
MSSDLRRRAGRRGESVAARYLERDGYRVVERNYRTREGEIDLVAISGKTLVFCEVKTLIARAGTINGPVHPIEGIRPAKRIQVRRMARLWLAERRGAHQGLHFLNIRFDAIGVLLSPSGQPLRLERIESAF